MKTTGKGLFGYLNKAKIVGINIELVSVDGSGAPRGFRDDYGSLAGHATDSSISNCTVTGAKGGYVKANDRVGGLIGCALGSTTIKSCSVNNINVNAIGSTCGGLVGRMQGDVSVTDCYVNNVNVSGQDYVGGFAGQIYNTASVENCYAANVNVSGDGGVGGFAGQFNDSASAVDCYAANVNVSGGSDVGGFAGQIQCNASATNCYAKSGVVQGGSVVGGFAGYIYGEKISTFNFGTASATNCYAQTDVTGEGKIGGFAGHISHSYGLLGATGKAEVKNAYATGSVTAFGSQAGGFVGYISGSSSSISNAYSTGTVLSTSEESGGFAGEGYSLSTISASYYDTTTSRMNKAVGGDSGPQGDITAYSTTNMILKASYSWSIADNTDGAALSSGDADSPWYIDNNTTYPYFWYQYDDHEAEDVNYDMGPVTYSDATALDGKKADFKITGRTPLLVTYAGAEKAYFPYTGTSMYNLDTTMPTSVPAAPMTPDANLLYSMGSVSKTGIIAFVESAPKLTAEKTSDRVGATYVGDTVTYTITVENKGDGAAKNVVIEDTLPVGVKYVADSAKIGGETATTQVSHVNDVLTISVGDIAVNQTVEVTFKVEVLPAAKGKSIQNNGVVTSDNHAKLDITDGNVTPVAAPELTAEKISDRVGATCVGDTVTYTITVTNADTATAAALGVVIVDTLPVGVEYVSGSAKIGGSPALTAVTADRVLTIPVGDIAVGTTATVTFKVKVLPAAKGNSIRNEGVVTSSNHTELKIDDKNEARVTAPELTAEKTSNRGDNTCVGDTVTYTITVENEGDGAAKNVVIEDTLPAGVEYVADSATIGGSPALTAVTADRVLTIPVGDIAVGTTATVTFKVKVLPAAKGNSIRNECEVTCDNHAKLKIDDGNGALVTAPDLTAEKTSNRGDDGTSTYVNDIVTYTIKVENKGNGAAKNVVIEDTLPDGVDYVSGSAKIGGETATTQVSHGNGVLTISVGDIAVDQTVEVTFKVKVLESAKGKSIRNEGEVTSSNHTELDIDDGNDDTVDTLKITYDANRGQGSYTDDMLERGDYAVLTKNETGIFRNGYTLIGWNTEKDYTGTFYALGKTIPALNVSMTLYAQWVKIGLHHAITFNWNDGRTSDIYTQRYAPNGESAPRPTNPVRADYTFTGWSEDPQGKNMYDFSSSVRSDIQLYAQWTEKSSLLNYGDRFAYIHGYADGTIRPTENIKRSEVAAIFYRLLTQTARDTYWTDTNNFNDISINSWYNNVVSTMTRLGVFVGYSDGSFKPDAVITRAELITAVVRFVNAEDYNGKDLFSDIAGHWAADSINQAAVLGWVEGSGDGKFRPDDEITRAEAIVIFNRVLGRQPEAKSDLLDEMTVWPDNMDTTTWYYLAIQEASNSHYFKLKSDQIHEIWTSLRDTPDWTALEKRK